MTITKSCTKCGVDKPLDDFYPHKGGRYGRDSQCRQCVNKRTSERDRLDPSKHHYLRRRRWLESNRERVILAAIKSKCKRLGIPFDLTLSDIVIPDVCPVLGIPIMAGTGLSHANSPSVDRIIPTGGYLKGNVQIISQKANAMKQDATVLELQRFAKWIQDVYPTALSI